MSNSHFTFPPPPPPPPQASGDYNRNSQYPYGQRGHRDRGRGGNRGSGSRGRGYEKGGPIGGYASGYGGYQSVDHRQAEGQNTQSNLYGSHHPLPNYPAIQQPQYGVNSHNAFSHPTQHVPQALYSYSPQPPFSGFPSHGPQPAPSYGAQDLNQGYGRGLPPSRSQDSRYGSPRGPTNQPLVMPPIRVGRDSRGGLLRTDAAPSPPPAHFNQGPPVYQSHQNPQLKPYQQPRYDAPPPRSNSRGRGHKRGYSDAFSKPRNPRPSGQVAPAVPSFGNPLPGSLPKEAPVQGIPNDTSKKPKKKKRRHHNQLGLTPKTEEHESSSEEEDDRDEEMKLAAAVGAASQMISFEYQGQTSVLQSSSEIAAWIAERKKRFPTKARAAEAAERRKQNEEARRVARQAAKESQEKRRAEAKERQEKQKAEAKENRAREAAEAEARQQKLKAAETAKEPGGDKEDPALKAKSKVERLRRRLEKEERRVAKAEAKAARKNAEPNHVTGPSESDLLLNDRKRKRTDSIKSDASGGLKLKDVSIKDEMTSSPHKVKMPEGSVEIAAPTDLDQKIAVEAAIIAIANDEQSQDTTQNPLTPTSQPSIPDKEPSASPLDLSNIKVEDMTPNKLTTVNDTLNHAHAPNDSNASLSSDISSDTSDSDLDLDLDSTSSSGSSSSSSPSDSDAAPETVSSKPANPPHVPPPPRSKSKTIEKSICRNFLRSGRCPRGNACHYRHELPEKGSASKAERREAREAKMKAKEERKKEGGRKGLYQRLVEQEKDEEDKRLLSTIIQMGERGLLSAPIPREGTPERKDPGPE